jgi:protein-S-isoprenylcysteine O-methyltransferase Ste14
MSGETLRAPRQQLRPLRASGFCCLDSFPRLISDPHKLSTFQPEPDRLLARSDARQHNSLRLRRGGTWVQRWRVPLGFVCGAVFLILARPRPLTLAIGGGVALIGLVLRAWASGHVRKNDTLAVSGPYAYTRNPLYLGSFLIGLGFTIAAGRWILGAVFAVFFLGIYLPVMRVESETMARLFGERYVEYARAVPLLLPRWRRYEDPALPGAKFDISLYLRYREYQALLGLLAAWALLALKAFFLK